MVHKKSLIFLGLTLLGSQIEAMLSWKTQQAQDSVATTYVHAQQVASGAKHVRDLPTAARMLVPMPTEYHVAAVELFDRILLCFVDSASEDVRRAGLRFLTGLQEVIDKCDGPLRSVWFRAKNDLKGTITKKENTLLGFFQEIAARSKFMAEPATRIIEMLNTQAERCEINEKFETNVRKQDGAFMRWSVPNGCWVFDVSRMNKRFLDPADSGILESQYRENLLEMIQLFSKVSDEEFAQFLGALEAHINSPGFKYGVEIAKWFTSNKVTEAKNSYSYYDSAGESAKRQGCARFESIMDILQAKTFRPNAILELKHQRAVKKNVEAELLVDQPGVQVLLKQVESAKNESAPVILALDRRPGDVRTQLALPAATNDDDEDAWMRTLLQETGTRTLALPAPKMPSVPQYQYQPLVPAHQLNQAGGRSGPIITEVTSSEEEGDSEEGLPEL